MKYRIVITVVLVGMLVLGGCGNKITDPVEPIDTTEQIETSETLENTANEEQTPDQTEPIDTTEQIEVSKTFGKIAYEELTEKHIQLFEQAGKISVDELKAGDITMDMMEMRQDDIIRGHIELNNLPTNGIELFKQWKEKTGYYNQFSKDTLYENGRNDGGTTSLDNTQKPDVKPDGNKQENNNGSIDDSTGTIPVQPNKPIKTPEQIEQQKPSNNDDDVPPLTDEYLDELAKEWWGSDGSGKSDNLWEVTGDKGYWQ